MKLLSALLFCFTLSMALPASPLQAGEQKVAQLKTDVTVTMEYLLYHPEKYEEQESWPLVLFLHGAGERGDNIEVVKKHGPPKLVEAGKSFPFIVVSPQCAKGKRWESLELIALLDEVIANNKVDEKRIYVTGLSMGGFGTWELASYIPDRIAAIAPICGGGEKFWARAFKDMPIWAFHGAKDTAVPIERSQVMIDELKRLGSNPKFTVYPEAHHDSWTESYNNPELYKWLLEHKLK